MEQLCAPLKDAESRFAIHISLPAASDGSSTIGTPSSEAFCRTPLVRKTSSREESSAIMT